MQCRIYLPHIMDKVEIENLIEEKVEEKASQRFDVIMEWFSDQFALVHEKFEMMDEKMDRQFAELKEDLEQVKRNTDTNSLDIINLDTRVTRIEKMYE